MATTRPGNASHKLDKKQLRQEAAAKREREAPLRKREKQLERKIDDFNSELRSLRHNSPTARCMMTATRSSSKICYSGKVS